jgi:hypothetical protein
MTRTLDVQQQLQAELSVLTEAQAELDQAMANVAPLQERVNKAQEKVAVLMTELQDLLSPGSRVHRGRPAGSKAAAKPGRGRKKAPKERNFTPEGRIKLARTAAEMQARRKGLAPRLVKRAGEAAAARKRAELGA